MYALKLVTNKGNTHSYILGNEYHIEQLEQVTPDSPVYGVTGSPKTDGAPENFVVSKDVDAYITTFEGKTVQVVNRAGWYI